MLVTRVMRATQGKEPLTPEHVSRRYARYLAAVVLRLHLRAPSTTHVKRHVRHGGAISTWNDLGASHLGVALGLPDLDPATPLERRRARRAGQGRASEASKASNASALGAGVLAGTPSACRWSGQFMVADLTR